MLSFTLAIEAVSKSYEVSPPWDLGVGAAILALVQHYAPSFYPVCFVAHVALTVVVSCG